MYIWYTSPIPSLLGKGWMGLAWVRVYPWETQLCPKTGSCERCMAHRGHAIDFSYMSEGQGCWPPLWELCWCLADGNQYQTQSNLPAGLTDVDSSSSLPSVPLYWFKWQNPGENLTHQVTLSSRQHSVGKAYSGRKYLQIFTRSFSLDQKDSGTVKSFGFS